MAAGNINNSNNKAKESNKRNRRNIENQWRHISETASLKKAALMAARKAWAWRIGGGGGEKPGGSAKWQRRQRKSKIGGEAEVM
jgi:hypothetical protein